MPLSTEAQLELITTTATNAAEKAATRSAKKAVRRYRNNAMAGFLVLAFGVGFTIYDSNSRADESRAAIVASGKVVSVSACNRDFDTIGILRGQIAKSKDTLKQYLAEGTLTPAQYKRAVGETNTLLAKYKQPDCREAEGLLTADPDKKVPHIEPKFLPKSKPPSTPSAFPGTEPKG